MLEAVQAENGHPTSSKEGGIRYEQVSGVLGALTFVLGAAVMLGYVIQNQALKSVFPGLVAMNPLTAIATMTGGVALMVLQVAKRDSLGFRIGRFLAVMTASIGGLKLAGIISGSDILIDHLLFSSQLNDIVTGYQNRMAPNTALNFLLIGTSIALSYDGKFVRSAQRLASATFFIAFLAVIGYAYGARSLTGVAGFIPIALNTAVGFIMLALGVLCANPKRGLMEIITGNDAGGAVARRLLPIAILAPALLGFLFRSTGVDAGPSSDELRLSLVVVGNIVVFSILIWRVAHDLHLADKARQIAVENLRKEKALNEAYLASIGDGVVAIDVEWNITLWNAAAAHITGWTREDAVRKPFRDIVRFIREHDRTENISFISEAMLSGKTRLMENHTLLIRKDGSEIPVGDSAAPIIGSDGRIIGAIIVFRDASAERDANLIRSSFAYASHQLRTPVTSALWNIEVLREEIKGAKHREKVDIALLSMRSVQKLVLELSAVSEIDQGMILPKPEAVPLQALLKELVGSTKEKIDRSEIDVDISPVPVTASIVTDAKLLSRALREILDNAIAYGRPSGKVRIMTSVNDKETVFEIVDEGIGIPDQQKNIVFTKFFRGQNIPKDSVGAGLGLYICREYVRLLGGKVWFVSKEGEGATFYVSIPNQLDRSLSA